MKPIIFINRQSSIYIGREARQGIKVKSGRIEKVKIGNGTAWKGGITTEREGITTGREGITTGREGLGSEGKGSE